MKTTFVVIAFILAFASLAECLNLQKELAKSATQIQREHAKSNKRQSNECFPAECVATGTTCYATPSQACIDCQTEVQECFTKTGDFCSCGNLGMKCILTNATDDTANCNPTLAYKQCKAYAPTCSCQNFTEVVPIPVCNLDSYCDTTANQCKAKTGAGQSCSSSDNCQIQFDSTSYTCENDKCVVLRYGRSIGDPCSNDDQCDNSETGEVSCVNSVCVGQNQGGNCTTSESCNYGLYCATSGLCEPQLKAGDDCDLDEDNCGYPTVCGFGSKCVQALTKARGADCEDDLECVAGSACVNNKCAAPPAEKVCTSDLDCPEDEGYTGECECTISGKRMCQSASSGIIQCINQFQTLYECANKYNCSSFDLYDSCFSKHCNFEAQCLVSCSVESSGVPASCYPALQCASGSSGTTAGGDSAAMTVAQVSMGLVALAVAASLNV